MQVESAHRHNEKGGLVLSHLLFLQAPHSFLYWNLIKR